VFNSRCHIYMTDEEKRLHKYMAMRKRKEEEVRRMSSAPSVSRSLVRTFSLSKKKEVRGMSLAYTQFASKVPVGPLLGASLHNPPQKRTEEHLSCTDFIYSSPVRTYLIKSHHYCSCFCLFGSPGQTERDGSESKRGCGRRGRSCCGWWGCIGW
jgi:hypothetical protein